MGYNIWVVYNTMGYILYKYVVFSYVCLTNGARLGLEYFPSELNYIMPSVQMVLLPHLHLVDSQITLGPGIPLHSANIFDIFPANLYMLTVVNCTWLSAIYCFQRLLSFTYRYHVFYPYLVVRGNTFL